MNKIYLVKLKATGYIPGAYYSHAIEAESPEEARIAAAGVALESEYRATETAEMKKKTTAYNMEYLQTEGYMS